MRVDDLRNRREEKRVAVRIRARRDFGRDQSAGTAAIVATTLLSETARELLRGDAAEYVGGAAGRKADDQPHRAIRIRSARAACDEQ